MTSTVLLGDCVKLMRDLAPESIDSIVCDPPYNLAFMGRGWDTHPTPLAFQLWCQEWATEALRVLKPGAHMLAFGGTRTGHRLTTGIEDAGFEIRDSIAWLRANGVPKAKDQLKPGHEPITVARKGFRGTLKANKALHGTGGLGIDACRLPATDTQLAEKFASVRRAGPIKRGSYSDHLRPRGEGNLEPHPGGRWPANVVLDEIAAVELDGGSKFYYTARASAGERPKIAGIGHISVKPLTLMRWLVRLITPTDGTVLDMFGGSGTTAEAAVIEGFDVIIMERDADFIPHIEHRLARVNGQAGTNLANSSTSATLSVRD